MMHMEPWAPLVLVTSRSFGSGSEDPEGLLASRGLRVVRGDPGHTVDALAGPLAGAVAWIAGPAPITDDHLRLAPRLRLIARYGTGVEGLNLKAARDRDILVAYTPGANSEAVADHAVALMLVCLRHVTQGESAVRSGHWPPLLGRELGALAVGLIGFGRVGRAVTARLAGFGSRVLAYDPFVDEAAITTAGARAVSLDTLVRGSDVISLHRPGGGPPVVDAAFLRRVRRGVVLVNTARGALVDEAALAAALREGRVGAAGVDVLASEPPARSPLLKAPNVVLTPHIAGQTIEAVDRMGLMAAREVIRVVVEGGPPVHPVTFGAHEVA